MCAFWLLAALVVNPSNQAGPTAALGGAERYLTHVSTDKPIYKPGETVYGRAVILEAHNHQPWAAPLYGQGVLKGPKGDIVARGSIQGTDGSVSFAWVIPDGVAGGVYTLRLEFPEPGAPPGERTLEVRAYRAPRLNSQIVFARDGYGPGDEVRATLHTERAEGGFPTDAQVTVTARVDDEEVYRGTARVDAEGNATTKFTLPRSISRGEGSLAMAVEDGGVVETASKTLPILLQTLDLTFYPEGGNLVAGLANRLYFEGHTPAGKPADLTGVVLDDTGAEAGTCRSAHEGRGRCIFTPKAGHSYALRVDEPAGLTKPFPLPEVHSVGGVLQAQDDVVGAGEPVRVAVAVRPAGDVRLVVSHKDREIARRELKVAAINALTHVNVPVPDDVDGVLTVTLWGSSNVPLAERLVFRRAARPLKVSLSTDKPRYAPGGTATVQVETRDASGKPVSTIIGATVTDESIRQMLETRDQPPRLPVMVFLEPEVHELADAQVYLDPNNAKAPLAVDLLLGTQGWRRFALVNVAAFLQATGDAGKRALAYRLPPPPPPPPQPIPMRPRAAGGAMGRAPARAEMEDDVPMAAAPPAMVPAPPMAAPAPAEEKKAAPPAPEKLAAPPAPEGPAVGKAAGAPPPMDYKNMKADAALIAADRVPRVASTTFAYVREYAHAVRANRKAQDRVDFAETLYFNGGTRTDKEGKATLRFGLSDSVTTFLAAVDAYDSSGNLGAATLPVPSVQPFYVEPKVPLSLTEGDLISLPLALVNNTTVALKDARVAVTLPAQLKVGKTDGLVSIAASGRSRRLVSVDTSGYTGAAELQVSANAGNYRDTVTRSIKVTPRGYPLTVSHSGVLKADSKEVITVDLAADAVPGSVVTEVLVYPSPLSRLTQALSRLLREPYGCFEQTSSTSYPLTMAQQYFTTHQGVDPAIVNQAKGLLTKGYNRLVGFECQEKGYEWFGGSAPGHEALTAYGVMQFADMRRAGLTLVDDDMLARTRTWLLGRRDGKGGFQRNSRALDSFGGAPEDTTNAYITWALVSAGETGLDKEVEQVKTSALKGSDSYVQALAADISFLTGDKKTGRELGQRLTQAQVASGAVQKAQTTITRSGGVARDIETTALATLAWLKDPTFSDAVDNGARYLASVCEGGRFSSTQGTVLALKAIVAYDAAHSVPKADGTVTVLVDGKEMGEPVPFTATHEDTIALPSIAPALTPGKHTVELRMHKGSDMPYSVAVKYHGATPPSSPDTAVTLSTTLSASRVQEGTGAEIRVKVVNPGKRDAAMPVAIIGVPGGLDVRIEQLKELVKAGKIAAYEVNERGEVVLYWRQLKAGAQVSLPIDVLGAVPGKYTGGASRAYEYYTDERKVWVPGLAVDVQPAS